MSSTRNMEAEHEDFPDELQDRLSSFDDAVSELEEILKPLHNVPIHQIHEEVCTSSINIGNLKTLHYRS